jgi:hypothetical protein
MHQKDLESFIIFVLKMKYKSDKFLISILIFFGLIKARNRLPSRSNERNNW